jgi:hypothetical protein
MQLLLEEMVELELLVQMVDQQREYLRQVLLERQGK